MPLGILYLIMRSFHANGASSVVGVVKIYVATRGPLLGLEVILGRLAKAVQGDDGAVIEIDQVNPSDQEQTSQVAPLFTTLTELAAPAEPTATVAAPVPLMLPVMFTTLVAVASRRMT